MRLVRRLVIQPLKRQPGGGNVIEALVDGVVARAMVKKGIHRRGVVPQSVDNFQIALNRTAVKPFWPEDAVRMHRVEPVPVCCAPPRQVLDGRWVSPPLVLAADYIDAPVWPFVMYNSFGVSAKKSLLMNSLVPGQFRLASNAKRLANPVAVFAHKGCRCCVVNIV